MRQWPLIIGAVVAISVVAWLVLPNREPHDSLTELGSAFKCSISETYMQVDTNKYKSFEDNYKKIEGWMDEDTKLATQWLMLFQLQNCVMGSIGEIGLYHGKYFFTMATSSHPVEKKVAIDLFDDQSENIDRSGYSEANLTQSVLDNAVLLGYSTREITLIKGNSMHLGLHHFQEQRIFAFRFFSVDGGHHYDAVYSDLALAAQVSIPTGVVAVNDIWNRGWMGVQDATISFIRNTGKLVPFLSTGNKLFLCKPESHALYYNHVTANPQYKCQVFGHISQHSINGWPLCFSKMF